MTTQDLAARVQRGIALLDEKGPSDWRSRIDLTTLDIDDATLCILAQLYGDYHTGCEAIGIADDLGAAAEEAGFMPLCDPPEHAECLTQAWKGALS